MYTIIDRKLLDADCNQNSMYLMQIVCDTASDLPTPEDDWAPGSEAKVLADGGSKYELSNTHEWTAVNFSTGEGGGDSAVDAYTKTEVNALLLKKVDSADGMGLSQNSFTDEDKSKLDDTYTKSETNNLVGPKANRMQDVLEGCGIKNQVYIRDTNFIFQCSHYFDIPEILYQHTSELLQIYCQNTLINSSQPDYLILFRSIVEMQATIAIGDKHHIPCIAKIIPPMYDFDVRENELVNYTYYIEYTYNLFGEDKRTVVKALCAFVQYDMDGNIMQFQPTPQNVTLELVGEKNSLKTNTFETSPSRYTMFFDMTVDEPPMMGNGEYLTDSIHDVGYYITENIDTILTDLSKFYQIEKNVFVEIVEKFEMAFIIQNFSEKIYLPLEFKRTKLVSNGQEYIISYRVEYSSELSYALMFEVVYNIMENTATANAILASFDGSQGSI